MNEIKDSLTQVFGFSSFLKGQEEVISRVMDNHSTLAVFPTGQGKSLCYQLPALHLPGLTLVVSPLMALMKDQVDFLLDKDIAVARLDSSLGPEELQLVYEKLRRGELKLLYVAPERFANERFLALISQCSISLMVIDEAHCISEWGHNFRPDYLKLTELTRILDVPTVLTLTATATPEVSEDIRSAFAIKKDDHVQTGFYRPNLTLRFSPGSEPFTSLLARLKENQPGPAIVYVTLQITAEKVAGKLQEKGFPAKAYHAGIKDEERQEVQEWFMASDSGIVVATIAFGMGIDKNNIRSIYHYNLPKSLENYAQEIGRAGRDGKQSICDVLGGSQDLTILENFVYGDTPDSSAISDMIDGILSKGERFDLSIYEESNAYDIRPLVTKTLLTYLELAKVIAATGPFYSSYKFKPHKNSEEILSRFDEERASFLSAVLSCAKKAKTWFTINLDEAASKSGSNRRRVITALNYLEEKGDLELQVSHARLGYRQLKKLSGDEKDQLKEECVARFSIREINDIKRLHQIVDLANCKGCKTTFLLNYFGEENLLDCGHCEFCLNGSCDQIIPAVTELQELQVELQKKVLSLVAEYPEALSLPRQQARFLCGISSPRLIRAKLLRHPSFGIASYVSFATVMSGLS